MRNQVVQQAADGGPDLRQARSSMMPGSDLSDQSIETEQLTARKAMVLHDDVVDLLGQRSLFKIEGRAACAQRHPVIVSDQCREFVEVDPGNLRGGGSASICIAAVVDAE